MIDFIDKVVSSSVPRDIVRAHIVPFLVAHPPKELLRDIQNYHSSYTRILQVYHHIWITELGEPEGSLHVQWFETDLLTYQLETYTQNFRSVAYRAFFAHVRSTIKHATRWPDDQKGIFTRRVWAMLTPEMRETIIEFRALDIISIVELMIW